jgi:hypothetical protein
MKWSFFAGACILATILLVMAGAPIPAIAAGLALAGLVNWMKLRKGAP